MLIFLWKTFLGLFLRQKPPSNAVNATQFFWVFTARAHVFDQLMAFKTNRKNLSLKSMFSIFFYSFTTLIKIYSNNRFIFQNRKDSLWILFLCVRVCALCKTVTLYSPWNNQISPMTSKTGLQIRIVICVTACYTT